MMSFVTYLLFLWAIGDLRTTFKVLASRIRENDEYRCNIEKRDVSEMMRRDFTFPDYPVIYYYSTKSHENVTNKHDYNDVRSTRSHKQPKELFERSDYLHLYHSYGDTPVVLSSSNTYSHGRIDSTLREYLENILSQLLLPVGDVLSDSTVTLPSSKLLANESYYLFGNNYQGIWGELSDLYQSPPCYLCDKAGAKTIGIGGKKSGVSFHFHGSGFSEVIHGAKSWYLFPPQYNKMISNLFDANLTVFQWHEQVYPLFLNQSYRREVIEDIATKEREQEVQDLPIELLSQSSSPLLNADGVFLSVRFLSAIEELVPDFFECTITPGQILYFPPFWMHATLNRDDYNVFFSHFLDLQLMKE